MPLEAIIIILLFIANALWIVGFYTACGYELGNPKSRMILYWLREYAERHLPYFYTKPICNCMPCMASLHGLWYWILPQFIEVNNWIVFVFGWILYTGALSGTMKLLSNKIDI